MNDLVPIEISNIKAICSSCRTKLRREDNRKFRRIKGDDSRGSCYFCELSPALGYHYTEVTNKK